MRFWLEQTEAEQGARVSAEAAHETSSRGEGDVRAAARVTRCRLPAWRSLSFLGTGTKRLLPIMLVGDRGAYRITKALEAWQIPATIQAILAARIDRLPPEDKPLLQAASVIGKDVPFTLLQAIADLPEESLRQGLSHLQAAEFLHETSLFPAGPGGAGARPAAPHAGPERRRPAALATRSPGTCRSSRSPGARPAGPGSAGRPLPPRPPGPFERP